jgi:hypothetical protein
MMVLLCGGVEGSAKIAMTPLLNGSAAMGLLPNEVPPGLIFPGTGAAQFVNLKLGSGTRPEDICELTNAMQKAERAGSTVIQPSSSGLVRVRARSQSLIGKK